MTLRFESARSETSCPTACTSTPAPREGAKALGLDPKAAGLHRFELPEELRVLEMHEVEDVLCIYKAQLAGTTSCLGSSR